MPAAAVIRRIRALSGFIGFKGYVGGAYKSAVKFRSLTLSLPLKLSFLSSEEGSGIPGVAVKCVDIRKNTGGEGGYLVRY